MVKILDSCAYDKTQAVLFTGEMRPPLTVVLVNNGGGGIFDFLPIADQVAPETFTQLWSTPQNVDLAGAALDHPQKANIIICNTDQSCCGTTCARVSAPEAAITSNNIVTRHSIPLLTCSITFCKNCTADLICCFDGCRAVPGARPCASASGLSQGAGAGASGRVGAQHALYRGGGYKARA